jgi:hypothetical protein
MIEWTGNTEPVGGGSDLHYFRILLLAAGGGILCGKGVYEEKI